MGKRDAVLKAARIRLRPILMTTVAMIVAMILLLMATGPGAVSRFDIGLVIASGLGIGTLFTLFMIPAVYMALARDRGRHPERLEGEPGAGSEEQQWPGSRHLVSPPHRARDVGVPTVHLTSAPETLVLLPDNIELLQLLSNR